MVRLGTLHPRSPCPVIATGIIAREEVDVCLEPGGCLDIVFTLVRWVQSHMGGAVGRLGFQGKVGIHRRILEFNEESAVAGGCSDVEFATGARRRGKAQPSVNFSGNDVRVNDVSCVIVMAELPITGPRLQNGLGRVAG